MSNDQKNMKALTTKQDGYSVIELLIVIGVIAFLIIIVFTIGTMLWGKSKDQQMTSGVDAISQGIHSIYAAAGGNYNDVSSLVAIRSGSVPSTLVKDSAAGIIGTAWYGDDNASTIVVNPAQGGRQFSVQLNAIPSSSCTSIGSKYLNGNAISVSANGQVANGPGELATACAGNGDTANLTINFS
ncbi:MULTISPECIES: type 4 pilus major pilin [Cysteiniphilum]|uniref:Type 4 secretion system PilS N-terminal domain-containing protein n=1 Tax=Cysteiniphilum litorale TaxID=2056700 RepID=A0A8J2Z360_9GAMM|nr:MULTISPECIES: type 4 pilus major pilin [Cysteiniphilum]GGF91988.1 hypothetical protein GCM10010995_06440 [Cysteiniphilum litorale]